jgi:hypothetical protein
LLTHHFQDETLTASTNSATDPLPLSNRIELGHFHKFQKEVYQGKQILRKTKEDIKPKENIHSYQHSNFTVYEEMQF